MRIFSPPRAAVKQWRMNVVSFVKHGWSRVRGHSNAEYSTRKVFKMTKEEDSSQKTPAEGQEPRDVFVKGVLDPFLTYLMSSEANIPLGDRHSLMQTAGIFRKPLLLEVKKEELMHRVIWGNQTGAEFLLEEPGGNVKRLGLLLCGKVTSSMTDPSGKSIKGLTAFQAALCAGDIDMCEMLKGYFKKLPNGPEIMHEQMQKIFPEGFPEDEKETPPHVVKQKAKAQEFKREVLTPLIDAIIAASDEDVKEMLNKKKTTSSLGQAFDGFREKMEKISFEDQVFNFHYFLEALALYDVKFNSLQSCDKRDLFCVQGIGFIQRYFPACYLQATAQGFDVIVHNEKLSRTFDFKYVWNGITRIFVTPISSLSGLGFDYLGRERAGGVGVGRRSLYAYLQMVLCSRVLSNKNIRLIKLYARTPNHHTEQRLEPWLVNS